VVPGDRIDFILLEGLLSGDLLPAENDANTRPSAFHTGFISALGGGLMLDSAEIPIKRVERVDRLICVK